MQSPALMVRAVRKPTMEELAREIARLRELVETVPRWHRKDLERMLGVSASTLSRRMKRRDFPKPIYDAGRPKWMPCQFNGQLAGQSA